MNEAVTDKIRSYLLEMLPEMELELFDIQFRQEDRGWILRIFIDTSTGEAGITLDQCSDVSRELGHYLDAEDCIAHSYTLEVSSPGLERPLRSIDDCQRHLGKMCKIRLHQAIDNQKVYIGEIADIDSERNTMTVHCEGKELVVQWEMINKARLVFT